MLNSTKHILQIVLNQRFSKNFILSVFLVFLFTSCSNLRFRTTKKEVLADFESKKFEHQHTGFMVVDMIKNDTLFNVNGTKYFTPASTTKLFTLYTSLQFLGKNVPALKYVKSENKTHVLATGDPTWLHPNFKDTTAISFLRQQDSIVLHLDNYAGEKYGPGWAWEDYPYYFSPELTALPLFGNVVTIMGPEPMQVSPSYFSPKVERKDGAPLRMEDKNTFYIPKTSRDTVQIPFITSDSLTLKLLKARVGKQLIVQDSLPNLKWKVLEGIPTDTVLKQMLVESDNFLAEQLMLMASSTLSDTLQFETARNFILENPLKSLSHKPRWVDGSGLSRYNLFTPASMVQVLRNLVKETDTTRLFSLMPKWNADGTMSHENPNGDKAFIQAKSGSMGNMYNLCGYIRTKSGKLLLFSFMNNHFRRPSREVRQDMYSILKSIHETY